MPFAEWSDEYCLGDDIIDSQHKKLFELISNLADAKNSDRKGAATACINELEQYVVEHFRYEEHLIRELGYPQVYGHIDKHLSFTGRIKTYKDAMVTGDVPFDEMLGFLTNWLVEHILVSDRQYATFLEWGGRN